MMRRKLRGSVRMGFAGVEFIDAEWLAVGDVNVATEAWQFAVPAVGLNYRTGGGDDGVRIYRRSCRLPVWVSQGAVGRAGAFRK